MALNTSDSATMTARAAARRAAWLPFGLAVLIVAVIAALALLLASGNIGVVTNTFVVVLCLLPLLIVALALVLVVMLGIWAVRRADKAAVQRLIQAENAARNAKINVEDGSAAVGKRFIGVAAAVERLAPLWDIFDVRKTRKGRSDGTQPEYPAKP